MRILVTGAFGYLGSHISDYFVKKGHAIRALSRTDHSELSPWNQQFEVVLGDVSEFSSIENCCQNIDVVIHAAAMNEVEGREKPREALMINGFGTRNILEDASRNGVKRFIYLSTFHVYGLPKSDIISENTLPDPIADYSLTHHVAEAYCRQFESQGRVKCHILRISNGYGAPLFKTISRWTLVLNDLCTMAFSQGRLVLKSKGTQERDFIGIKDILQGIDIFVEHDVQQCGDNIYNLGSEQNISIISLANTVANVYQERYSKSITVEIPDDACEPDIQTSFRFSIERIKNLGFRPTADIREEIHNIFSLLES